MGTVNLLEAMRFVKEVKAGVFITSDKCYENVEWFYGYREDDTLGGSDPYSASKACAEIAISSMTRSFMTEEGFRISSARAGNVIGGGDWALNRIIPDIVRKWNNGEELLMRNPNSTRPWQHVLEPLSGYLALGEHLLKGSDEVTGEAFNFGPRDNTDISVGEVVKSMNQYIDGKWAIEKNVTMKKEAGLLKLNCDKAKTFLDWSSTMDYEKTIEFTALWYKEFYNNKTPKMLDFTNKQITEYCDIAKSLKLTWAL
jgi:CDP-glucose 4,6-dehydratase